MNGVKVAPSAWPVTVIVPVSPLSLPSAAVTTRSAAPWRPGQMPQSSQTAFVPVTSQSGLASPSNFTSATPATPLRSKVRVKSPPKPPFSSSSDGLLREIPTVDDFGRPFSGYGCSAVSAGPPSVNTGVSAACAGAAAPASEAAASRPAAANEPAARCSTVLGVERVIGDLWDSAEAV